MPSTYTPIATTTLGSPSSTITFSSISGIYTDLILISTIKSTTGNNARLTFNNDSSSLYSNRTIGGTGGNPVSRNNSNTTSILLDLDGYNITTEFNLHTTHIQNYSNTTTNKGVMTRSGSATTGFDEINSLYRSTSAITRIDLTASAGSFAAGSTFTLYGIKAA